MPGLHLSAHARMCRPAHLGVVEVHVGDDDEQAAGLFLFEPLHLQQVVLRRQAGRQASGDEVAVRQEGRSEGRANVSQLRCSDNGGGGGGGNSSGSSSSSGGSDGLMRSG